MKLDVPAAATAGAVLTALTYAVCFGLYAIAPEGTASFFSYVLHTDLMRMTRILTWGSFFAGLVFWTAAAGVVSAAFAWVYNRVVERVRIPTVERERVRV